MKGLWLAAKVFYLSWMVAMALLVPTGIGALIDRQLGSFPWVTLSFTLVGTVLASLGVIRLILREFDRIAPPDIKEEDASVPPEGP